MIRVERRVHIVRVRAAVCFLCQQHSFHIVRRFISAVNDVGDEPFVAAEREIEQRIYSAGIKLRDRVSVRPRLSYEITVGTNAAAGFREESQEFDICFRICINIIGHRIQPETVNTFPQPESQNIADFSSHSLARKVQIRHFRPESRLVVPVSAQKRSIAAGRLSAEVIVIEVFAIRHVRFCPGRQFVQIIRRSRKPCIVFRRVVEYQIHIHADAPLMALFE